MRRLTPLLPLFALALWPCPPARAQEKPAAAAGPALVKLVPLNLAQGKPATASGSQDDKGPDLAADGDKTTRWCAPNGDVGHWWRVDLGEPQEITTCRINWEFDNARYRYKLEGSPDGTAWQVLADVTGDNAPATREHEHKLSAKDVRFVRVTVTGLEPGRFASIHEVELYGRAMVEASKAAVNRTPALLREIKAPAGMKVTIFAAPPEVSYPVALAAAPNGDVFVAVDDNGSLGQKTGRGKIIRCRDTNDDGVADEFKTFAQLDSPRGLVWDAATNTMYVQHPPFVRAYRDVNGDGIAESDEVLVSGLGFDLNFRGADHTTNQMQLGIDGWLYVAVGDYGFVKATAKDGKTLQLFGGGVVRVRPDGTQLEIVSRGQRNIYDVAVSPTLDLFTRDNTNDGDGWDVRLSHVIPGGHYGYPLLFKNFGGEIVQPLASYGGGSPTGSLFLDEPVLPDGLGRALYTCDWGTNAIYRHPLTPAGASFKAEQQAFVEMPRPVDMAVDGRSRLFIASWRNGGFAYTEDNVGYVARLSNADRPRQPMREMRTATNDQLLQQLGAGDSHVRRLAAQREILRRGNAPAFVEGLRNIAARNTAVEPRVAAIFTLALLDPEGSRAMLGRISADPAVREYALRALSDAPRAANPGKAAAQPFLAALKNPDPRVRLQAVTGVARHGTAAAAADALVPLMLDADPLVAHAATNALVGLGASDACFKAFDSGDAKLRPAAVRVLQSLHDRKVVAGLLQRYERTRDPAIFRPILTALCRLCYREAEWTSGWWGTRPDTSGPYYNPAAWEQTETIQSFLRTALLGADADTLPFLLLELQRHKIELKEAMPRMINVARRDPTFQAAAAELLTARPNVPPDAMPLLAEAAGAAHQNPALRVRALGSLLRLEQPEALNAVVGVLSRVGFEAPAELARARAEFLRDAQHAKRVPYFAGIASTDPGAARRALAFGVLLQVATSKQSPADAVTAAKRAINDAWVQPDAAAALLRAIGREKVDAYAVQARSRVGDPNPTVKDAAAYAVAQLTPPTTNPAGPAVDAKRTSISTIGYDQTLAAAQKLKGDAKFGAELFLKQGCVACHTVSKSESPKGPFLGGIGQRYSRAELIESILKPNAKITQGFVTHYFLTKKRDRVDGFVVREAADEVEVRTVNGASVTVKTADVARKGTLPTSVMPESLVDNLSPDELASLVAYLESLKTE